MPELRDLPLADLHAPWQMPPLAQKMHGFTLGRDYPMPVVAVGQAHGHAKARLTAIRRTVEANRRSRSVYLKHGSRSWRHRRRRG